MSIPISAPARRVTLGWFLLALSINLIGNGSYSLFDRDEPRYAEASRRMLAEGDWVVPKLGEKNRYDKPILTYWLEAPAMALFGVNEFSARFPAALAGACSTAVLHQFALDLGASLAGANVAAMAATTMALLLVTHKAATTDGVLTLTVVLMLWLLWRQRARGFTWPRHVSFSLVLAASLLVKGPPGLLIMVLTLAGLYAWNHEWSAAPLTRQAALFLLRTLVCLAIVIVIAGPWAWLAHVRTQGEFFAVALGKHVGRRMVESMEGHSGPVVYYLLLLPVLVFPWTAQMILALRHAWSERTRPPWRFLICWLVPSFVVFSLVKTKLPHYIAPLLPGLALMLGLAWDALPARMRSNKRWPAVGLGLFALIGVALGLGLIIGPKLKGLEPAFIPGFVCGLLVLGWTGLSLQSYLRRDAMLHARLLYGGFALVFLIAQLWLLRAIEPMQASKQLVAWVRANAPPGTKLMAADYREQSLLFYARQPVMMWGNSRGNDALTSLTLTQPMALITTRRRWDEWIAEHHPTLPTRVWIRHEGRYLWLNKGTIDPLLVVGNW